MIPKSPRIEPLFQRLPSILAYPAAPSMLWMIAALCALRLLAHLPSLLGLAFELIFWVMGFKLAVEALVNTAHGRIEPLGRNDLAATDGEAVQQMLLQVLVSRVHHRGRGVRGPGAGPGDAGRRGAAAAGGHHHAGDRPQPARRAQSAGLGRADRAPGRALLRRGGGAGRAGGGVEAWRRRCSPGCCPATWARCRAASSACMPWSRATTCWAT